ncbi:MAG: S1 RNA-binding domain-containing protein [Polyangiaceae bacterium]
MADENKGFAEMFAEMGGAQTTRRPREGEKVTGTIVAINDDSVFVDLGAKAEGVVDRSELLDADGKGPAVGDSVTATVASTKGGQIVLRVKAGRGEDTSELENAYNARMPVVGKVTGVNKGGLEVQVGPVRAFCPLSQIDVARVEDPGAWVGRELEFRITKYKADPRRPDIVLSRRALLDEARAAHAAATLSNLEVGAVVRGKVTRLKEFGAFVDLGGVEGLIHKSELGFGRVDDPSEVISVGDVVEAQVTKIEVGEDAARQSRIGLSLRALQPDPFESAGAGLAAGSIKKGTVTRLEPFGAFVALADGVEGLVHISEIAERRINHPREALSQGDQVEVLILEVDPERRRLSLSIKQVGQQLEKGQAAAYKGGGGGGGQSLGTFADLLKGKLKS